MASEGKVQAVVGTQLQSARGGTRVLEGSTEDDSLQLFHFQQVQMLDSSCSLTFRAFAHSPFLLLCLFLRQGVCLYFDSWNTAKKSAKTIEETKKNIFGFSLLCLLADKK